MSQNTTARAKEFYSRSRERWGPSGILPHHRVRADSLERLCGNGKKRVLELGAGAGGTAAAIAELGHEVLAVDIAPLSVSYAHELARVPSKGKMTVLEADFFSVKLDGKFDVVGYWNGFGIGTDSEQRKLLKRISSEWLAPNGSLLLDVFNPTPWILGAGKHKQVESDSAGNFIQFSDFDPIGGRFLDRWQFEESGQVYTQSIRCYTPADFLLLLEGTGLQVKRAEVNEVCFNFDEENTIESPIWNAWDYSLQLINA